MIILLRVLNMSNIKIPFIIAANETNLDAPFNSLGRVEPILNLDFFYW